MSYESTGGSLKLKGVTDKKIKKKKKSKSSLADTLATVNKANTDVKNEAGETSKASNEEQVIKPRVDVKALKTKAELAYERAIDRKLEETILKRAEKSHKEHVEVFNKHLESLSEFHDIPKVSWTK